MLDITIKEVKDLFLDEAKIQKLANKGTVQALMKTGAYIRAIARNRIKSSPGPAAPGESPHSHTGLLKNNIEFVVDPNSETLVVGPVKLSGRKSDDIAEILEFGGTATRRVKGKKVTAHYRGNPYMGPSLDAAIEQGKVSSAFRGCIRN